MTGQKSKASIPIVASIAPLAAGVEAWICDVWGVLHNGVAAYAPAVDACLKFRAAGGVVVLLTNAPRPAGAVEAQLAKLGVPREAFDAVVTSGDLTRRLIEQHKGAPVFHLGPARDKGLFEGLSVRFSDAEAAGVVVCTGLFDDTRETPEDYRILLGGLAGRDVPMICANPDIVVERGEHIVYCAGALAQLYEELGGRVIYAGKPHLPVYERAFELIAEAKGATVERSRILAIGDGIHTDIEGALRAGLRAVFVASGVHVEEPLEEAKLPALFGGVEARPVAAMHALVW
jgi:HAD superfamily hydrolase (TIGR01459 family)